MNKTAGPSAAWGSSPYGSYVNTAFPFSQLFGMTDRIPKTWVDMFPHTEGGQRAAHITFKAGFDALLAAGLIALYRGANHISRMADMAKSDNPAKGMKSQLSTTFAGSLEPEKQKKNASSKWGPNTLDQPAVFSMGNAFGTALPLGAVLLATAAAYKATDDYLDKQRNKALDVAIKSKENALKRLIKTRSRLAKGNATDGEVQSALRGINNEDLYVKQAGMDKQAFLDGLWDAISGGARTTVGGFSALSCLLLGAAAVGSYYYFSKADENNVRYRAMKHGLKEYARTRTGYTPIAIIPSKSRKFFADIDEENAAISKKKKEQLAAAPSVEPVTSVRDEKPLLTEDYNKPISLTL